MDETALSRATGEWTISANPRQRSSMGLLTLYLFLLLAIPARLVFEPLGSTGTPAAMVALGALVLWMGSRLVPNLTTANEPQPVRWALGFFALSVLASYLAAMLGAIPITETGAADKGLIKLAILCGVALLAAEGLRDADTLERFMGRLVIGVAAVAAIGILQFPTGFSLDFIQIPGLTANSDIAASDTRGGFFRVESTTLHPIELAVVLAMTLPIALYRAMAAPKGLIARWRWLLVLAILLALPMTISRTAFLCLAVVLALLLPTWQPKYVFATIVLVMLTIVAVVITVPAVVDLFYKLVINIGADNSFTGRTDDYAVVGQFIYDRPLLGRGFSTFDPVKYVLLDNQYLGTLIETGAVGFLALATMFLIGICSARGARKRSTRPLDRARAYAIYTSLVAAVVSFMVYDAWAFPTASALVMLMLGSAGAAWRIAWRAERKLVPAPPRPARASRPRATAGQAPSSRNVPVEAERV